MKNNSNTNIGCLFALEGIDNAGKSTLIDMVANKLNEIQIPCSVTKELSTPIGNTIIDYLHSSNFSPHLKTLLFAADRIARIDYDVSYHIKNNEIVLADRWIMSAIVYRAIEGFDEKFVRSVNSKTMVPTKTFLIDIPAEVSKQRQKQELIPCKYDTVFLEKARMKYLELAEKASDVQVLNGMRTKHDLCDEIFSRILETWSRTNDYKYLFEQVTEV